MRSLTVSLALASLLLLSRSTRAAEAGEATEFDDWAHRPHEKFEGGAQAFQQAKAEMLKSYVRADLSEDDLYRAAVQGMLRYADPERHAYNTLLSPAEANELQTDMKGELVGIGVEIAFDASSGLINVNGVLAGSPAEAADLHEGDKILTIDGRSFKSSQMRDVVYAIRGKEGAEVRLDLLRDAQVLTKRVRREKVKVDLVSRDALPGDIDVIRIRSFGEPTPAALKAALEEAKRHGARGLIVDLRRCPGGLLDKSIEAAHLLLPKGATVVRITKRGGQQTVETNPVDPILVGIPTAVLIDGETRSSAEFLAAALREGLKAPLIGQKTFGKWTVQTLSELPNHFVMKYTVATFHSPEGKSYDGVGLAPDVEVTAPSKDLEHADHLHQDPAAELAADVQLRAAYNLLHMQR